MTHEDQVRKMPIEKLAELLIDRSVYQQNAHTDTIWYDGFGRKHTNRNNAIACEIAWLKQEIE